MPHTLAVCTHKGGTGKTVTAITLAAGFAEVGRRVLSSIIKNHVIEAP